VRGLVVVLGLFYLTAQLFVLPPDGWVTGDQGSKYLQTRAFADNGPLNPGIDVRARDLDPDYRYQEPKMKNRRGRLVSEFLWLLPLLASPFYRLFGLRGLYVVPALSVIAIAIAAVALARRLAARRAIWLAWMAVIATPLIVYGLELWEHAPAAACVMIAAALAYPADADRGHDFRRLFAAGAAVAIGALFREEVAVAGPAIVVARAAIQSGHRWRSLLIAGLSVGLGSAAVFAAAVPSNLLIYGAALPMHMTQDAWEVAKSLPYMQVRRDMIVGLLLPADYAAVFVIAGAAAAIAAAAQSWRLRRNAAARDDRTATALIAVVHAAVLAILILTVVLPLWRLVSTDIPGDPYRITSAAHTWIFALALLYWPWFREDVDRRAARYLVLSALLVVAGTFVLVPTDGGSQWSPRFFLAAAPLFAIVAAAAAIVPSLRPARHAGARRTAAGVVLIASMVMQLTGMGWVKHSKTLNARMTAWMAARTAPGDVLISDVYWFPEVTATLAPTRRMLFSWKPGEMPAMAARAAAAGFREFRFVTSPHLTNYHAPPVLDLPGAPCRYTSGPPIGIAVLMINEYSCAR
jgi:hypothetical protein